MKTLFKVLGLLTLILTLSYCGQPTNNNSASVTCSPNIIDSGLQVQMTPVSPGSNVYGVTLCGSAQPSNAVYSVYGGNAIGDVSQGTMNVMAAIRLANITGVTQPGGSFQVTFKSTDHYFAIYQDSSSSTLGLDNSQVMVGPHPIPGS